MRRLLSDVKTVARGVRQALDVRRRKLRTISVLATDRCSSRCKHCFIWDKSPNFDLSPEVFAELLQDEVVGPDTYFELTGGEFLEHPEHRALLGAIQGSGHNYMLLSNGMFPDQLVEVVREFQVPNLYMSLDGLGETYKKVRGVDCAGNVLRLIDTLKGETNVFIAYTITPWNKLADLRAVRALCAEKGVTFFVGAYQNPEFFDTRTKGGHIPEEQLAELGEFMTLHNAWMDKRVSLPCWNVVTKTYVMPNGDVHLCQQKSLVLGNLYERSLSAIWNAVETRATHERYRDCNDCWLACNRPFDAELANAARLALPRALLDQLAGSHTWDTVRQAYRTPAPQASLS